MILEVWRAKRVVAKMALANIVKDVFEGLRDK
jgi:hypothetical protein